MISPEEVMNKWEYLVVDINFANTDVVDKLDALGVIGWELVSAINIPNTYIIRYIFKRRLVE